MFIRDRHIDLLDWDLQVYHEKEDCIAKTLEMCEKYGIGILICDSTWRRFTSLPDEGIISAFEKYKDYACVWGYHVIDEPSDANQYARIVQLMQQVKPGAIAQINFFPIGALADVPAQMEDFLSVVGKGHLSYLSYDQYPFSPEPNSVPQMFNNMEDVYKRQYDDREVRLHYPKEEQEAAAKISNDEEEINRAIMKVCEKYGLRCNISDTRIWRAFNGSENWRDEIREMADAYRGYPALFSFHIKDEPATRDEFDRIARVKHYLEELNPDVEGYVNLLPGNGEKYEADLEYFIEAVRPSILSYDRYHFGPKRIELSSLSQIDMQSNR